MALTEGQLAKIRDVGFRKRRFTVSNSATISKGKLLKLTDPFTAAVADAVTPSVAVACAGIAGSLKEINDGSTSLDVIYDCVAELTASGAIAVGSPVTFILDNYVAAVPSAVASTAFVVGYAMETATTGEVINVRVLL